MGVTAQVERPYWRLRGLAQDGVLQVLGDVLSVDVSAGLGNLSTPPFDFLGRPRNRHAEQSDPGHENLKPRPQRRSCRRWRTPSRLRMPLPQRVATATADHSSPPPSLGLPNSQRLEGLLCSLVVCRVPIQRRVVHVEALRQDRHAGALLDLSSGLGLPKPLTKGRRRTNSELTDQGLTAHLWLDAQADLTRKLENQVNDFVTRRDLLRRPCEPADVVPLPTRPGGAARSPRRDHPRVQPGSLTR